MSDEDWAYNTNQHWFENTLLITVVIFLGGLMTYAAPTIMNAINSASLVDQAYIAFGGLVSGSIVILLITNWITS